MKRLAPLLFIGALILMVMRAPAAPAASSGFTPLDAAEIQLGYQNLTQQFYKKTDPQAILNSARKQLLVVLQKGGVANARLASLHAGADAQTNTRAIEREVQAAAHLAHSHVSVQDLTYAAISGMMQSVSDRYTVFLTPQEYAALNDSLDGGKPFAGTGIVIQVDEQTKYIDVSSVVPNAPADKAGVQQDDIITAIDGVSTKGLTLTQASSKLRGKAGTAVALTITRDDKPLPTSITVVRAAIQQLSVYEKMLPNKIGYVELTVFGRDTGTELTAALDRLQQQGARAYVMDLRDNGGGYLNAAVDVSSKFIASGPIVSVESRASNITTLEANNTAIPPAPLAVLVNGHTASASEITSGAIQDSGVGTIIGTKTFGKGVVQTIYQMPDLSAVKITTARYLTPHNRDINHLGIAPDITLAENKNPHYGDPARDLQLVRALSFLEDKLAHLNSSAGS
ncbi:MAG: S41 family peptidase [Candidatus Baltobacteraceae bacterium]